MEEESAVALGQWTGAEGPPVHFNPLLNSSLFKQAKQKENIQNETFMRSELDVVFLFSTELGTIEALNSHAGGDELPKVD